MIPLIKNAMSFSVICFIFMTVFACGGDEDETRKAGGGLESGGEATNPGGEFRRAHVCVLEMNFRTEPSADAARVPGREVLYWGVEFDVLAEEGDWVRVRLDDGTEGWLRAEYEGKEYIGTATSEERLIGSEEFLGFAGKEAKSWDGGARLVFLCGSSGCLDGKCYQWMAFYRSPSKPGKKLMCGYDVPMRREKGYLAEEWEEDWVLHGTDDMAEVAPGPAWWHYEDREIIRGFDFISTGELCEPGNLREMIATAKREMSVDLASVAADYGGFDFVLDENRWLVGIRTHTDSYNFYFNARTGEFSEFELVEFEGP